ncbi:hemD [Wigglesworthia glossinidia endosymbiont of Glossina brevipalpis]|uniref:Uroporphyrinogen-III synthase n=1 Tax=Wigglesworthia glossinidia brevipalpis TaxID=36870 RepID=Q8D2W1_WIGBR|nr:hemD [Wigglesworthia glossinidia endosymbiont of Glossina brevipalpis]
MTILITRPYPHGQHLINMIRKNGKEAWYLPLIYFTSGIGLLSLTNFFKKLQEKDIICSLSPRATKYANYQILLEKCNWPKKINYYAIGKTSAFYLSKYSKCKVIYPKLTENSENLLDLISKEDVKKKILILKGNNGRKFLENKLKLYGAYIINVECYKRNFIKYNKYDYLKKIINLKINTLVVTSSEILHQLHNNIPLNYINFFLINFKLVVVSKRISDIADNLGWKNIIVSKSSKNKDIIQSLL